jgi:hypothetical protein
MSSRPFLKRYPIIEDGDMSANITSEITILQMLTVGTYAYSWAGTAPVGTVTVEISNDYAIDPAGNVLNAGTWTQIYFTINGSSVVNSAPVTGNTGTGVIEFTTGAYAIRTKYNFTSGTGVLQAVINCKVA